jgi:hypothetical protein
MASFLKIFNVHYDTTTWKIQGDFDVLSEGPSLETWKFSLYFSGSCIPVNPKLSYKWLICPHTPNANVFIQLRSQVLDTAIRTRLALVTATHARQVLFVGMSHYEEELRLDISISWPNMSLWNYVCNYVVRRRAVMWHSWLAKIAMVWNALARSCVMLCLLTMLHER